MRVEGDGVGARQSGGGRVFGISARDSRFGGITTRDTGSRTRSICFESLLQLTLMCAVPPSADSCIARRPACQTPPCSHVHLFGAVLTDFSLLHQASPVPSTSSGRRVSARTRDTKTQASGTTYGESNDPQDPKTLLYKYRKLLNGSAKCKCGGKLKVPKLVSRSLLLQDCDES